MERAIKQQQKKKKSGIYIHPGIYTLYIYIKIYIYIYIKDRYCNSIWKERMFDLNNVTSSFQTGSENKKSAGVQIKEA